MVRSRTGFCAGSIQRTFRFRRTARMASAICAAAMLGTASSVVAQEPMGCAFGASALPAPIPIDPAEMTRAVPLAGEDSFTIVLNAGPGLRANPAALAAFQRAATRWEAVIRDPITVTIDADFAEIEGGALGQTIPVRLSFDLDLALSLITLDASDEGADGIAASLPLGAELDVALPGTAVSGSLIVIDKANLKALGFDADSVFGPRDGQIQFNTAFTASFDFDRSNITADAQRVITEAAAAAKAGNVSRIQLTGHTDRSGSDQYNMALSLRRGEAVKQALIRQGIPAASIAVIGRGERQPLVPTADGVREPQNRRVEILL